MKNRNHPVSAPSFAPQSRSPHERRVTTSQLKPQILWDAVVAGYIHDISARHRHRRTGWSLTAGPAAEPAR